MVNALEVMDNQTFLSDLKFGVGDGELKFYLFNWRCRQMNPSQVGFIVL